MRATRPGVVAAVGIGIGAFAVSAVLAQGTSFTTIERGRYLVQAGDCAACHTAEGGKSFAGGRAIPTPFGTIYSTNITPDKDTGIGRWSNEDFYKAMHKGIGRDGKHFYPAFPYPWYTKLGVDDVRAIKAYVDTLPAVKQANKPPDLPWPLSMRVVMAGWNGLYFREGAFHADASKSAQWNRGAYLVEGLGHCGACHTPKTPLGGPEKNRRLEGGYGEHWYASSLSGDLRDGLGAWTAAEIVEYLKTGSNSKAAAAGPMAEVVENSTQHLSDGDLAAIAGYLKDMPRIKDQRANGAGSIDNAVMDRGKALYVDNCTGCHLENGVGIAQVFPPLKASAPVQAEEPSTVLQAIIEGATVVATKDKPTALAMPAFGWKLSNQEIADLTTYIRNAWGNHASTVDAGAVADVRKQVRRSAGR
jgi:mono/diheme cytochrome c family protein